MTIPAEFSKTDDTQLEIKKFEIPLELKCKECKKPLDQSSALTAIIRNPEKEIHHYCHSCLRIQVSCKNIFFSDTYANFVKRFKTGFILQLMQEYK